MSALIHQAAPYAVEDEYELVDSGSNIILPSVWAPFIESFSEESITITMRPKPSVHPDRGN